MKKRIGWITFGKRDERYYFIIDKNHQNSDSDFFNGFEIRYYPKRQPLDFKIELGGYFSRNVQITFSILFGWFVVTLPIRTKYNECDPPRYGFYYFEKAFWICLGRKTKCIRMPWDYTWQRTSVLLKNQSYAHSTPNDQKSFYKDEWQNVMWKGKYVYTYILNNGTVQERFATIRVEEMEWRQRWLTWTSKFAMIRKYINIDFSDEVGERTGSYKGGTMGCSYSMLPKESPLACLRRMERERKF